MFKIGQKVVCINSKPDPNRLVPQGFVFPVKGKTYTVREVVPSLTHSGVIGLLLEEIKNPSHPKFNVELSYDSSRFKPIDMIDDSVEWAESILEQMEEEIESEICIDI